MEMNSAEMDGKLDGTPPSQLQSQDVSTSRLQGIHFKNVSLTVRNRNPLKVKKELLFNLSGHFPSGQLSAIIGPSGSGKSSLLAVLAGHRRPSEGQVAPRGQRRRHIAQQCVFPEVLTALEALTAAAALKLNAPPASRRAAVRRVLAALSLTQSAHTPCHALSGGQRKRLSVALELIDEPPILLLDEPTTGLDCVNGLQCLRLLQKLARSDSRTIVCTIHQPSARLLELLDQIYLLAAGHCLYRGPADGLLPKLTAHNLTCPTYHNPADFAMDVACGEYGSEIVSKLIAEASSETTCGALDELQYNKEKRHATSCWTQFAVMTRRNLFTTFQEKSVIYTRVIAHLVKALMLGALFYDIGNDAARALNNPALYTCALSSMFYTGVMPTIISFPLQKQLFKGEFANCWYSLAPYFLASVVSQIPLLLLNSSLFMSIVYWMSGQPNDLYIFSVSLFSAFMTGLISSSLGHMVGILAGLTNGMFLGSILFTPQVVFSGYFIILSNTPLIVRIFAHASSVTMYGFHAIMSSTFGHGRPKFRCDEPYCYLQSPKKLLALFDMTEDEGIGLDVVSIIIFLLVLQLCTYLLMKFKYQHLQR